MSTISSKEKNMLLIGATVVLYGIAAVCYKAQMPNWKKEQRIYQSAEKKLTDERALIAARETWKDQYETLRELMPVFPYDKDVETHWLRIVDAITTEQGLYTDKCQPAKEIEVGGVSELPIDCKTWEGSLDALVKSIYELNTQDGAMMDVRKLFIQTVNNKPGTLRGSFTLYSAYMRGN